MAETPHALPPDRDREAVRPRPRLRARSQRAHPRPRGRGADLPDRPFPRQGNRPEHHDRAVREHDDRARLECGLHRARPDHRRRDGRRRHPRQVLRRAPARCATWSPTTCSSCSRWSRWSRPRASMPRRSATKRARCSKPSASIRPARRSATASAAQYTAGKVKGVDVPAYTAIARRRAGQPDRDLCRAEADGRHVALGGRAVLPAHRQGDDVLATPRSSITFKPVPFASFPGAAADMLPPNRLIIQIQPDEGLSMDINIKRPGLEVDDRADRARFPLCRRVRYRSPDRVRVADLRPVRRRPDAVPARRRDRGGLGRGAAVPRPLGA